VSVSRSSRFPASLSLPCTRRRRRSPDLKYLASFFLYCLYQQ
jgi:hypothetical protein